MSDSTVAIITAVSAIFGGLVTKAGSIMVKYFTAKQKAQLDEHGHIAKEYRELVDKLQESLDHLQKEFKAIDKECKEEVESLTNNNTELRIENAKLMVQLKLLSKE